MSENIGDITKQLTLASSVGNTDYFWLLTGAGQAVKIPADLVKAYIATGVSLQFRGGATGIEISYDGGATWTEAVPYTEMNITKMVALTQAEYDALVAAGTVDSGTYYSIFEE